MKAMKTKVQAVIGLLMAAVSITQGCACWEDDMNGSAMRAGLTSDGRVSASDGTVNEFCAAVERCGEGISREECVPFAEDEDEEVLQAVMADGDCAELVEIGGGQ